ncbi:hypothetical protein RYX36_025313, partial [Vicia faba]
MAFKGFCKLAVDMRPVLLPYVKFTVKSNEIDLVDVEEELSLTEKTITSAYDIFDSKKEVCFLLFSSITDGVWSVVEKDVDSSSSGQSSTITNKIKHAYKKRRVIKKPTKHALNVNEDGFLKIGYSSVKEVTVKRSSSSWTVTLVVQYFYVLPYSEIISEWFSRETFSNSLQDSKLVDKQFPKLEVTKSS